MLPRRNVRRRRTFEDEDEDEDDNVCCSRTCWIVTTATIVALIACAGYQLCALPVASPAITPCVPPAHDKPL